MKSRRRTGRAISIKTSTIVNLTLRYPSGINTETRKLQKCLGMIYGSPPDSQNVGQRGN